MARIVAPIRRVRYATFLRSRLRICKIGSGISDALDERPSAGLAGKRSDDMDRLAQSLEMQHQAARSQKVAQSFCMLVWSNTGVGARCGGELLRKAAAQVGRRTSAAGGSDDGTSAASIWRAAKWRRRGHGSKTRCRCGTRGSVERTGHAALLSRRCDAARWALERSGVAALQAKELALRLLDQRGLAESKRLLGLIHLRRGDKQKALELCQRALERAQQSGCAV